MDNNNLSSDFVPHITRIAKLMDSKVRYHNCFCDTAYYLAQLSDIEILFFAIAKKSDLMNVENENVNVKFNNCNCNLPSSILRVTDIFVLFRQKRTLPCTHIRFCTVCNSRLHSASNT